VITFFDDRIVYHDMPVKIVTQIVNQSCVIQSTVGIQALSTNLDSGTYRLDAYSHDLVSNGFIGNGVDHITE
jgi:hypothetical protein